MQLQNNRRLIFAWAVALAAAFQFLADPCSAEPGAGKADKRPAAEAAKPCEEGFVDLLKDQPLSTWEGNTAGWRVEGERFICTKKGGRIQTKKHYGDFVFRFEYLLQPGGNNGVHIRGMEIQVLDDHAPKHARLKPCQYNGSIYCHVPAEKGHENPPGQWNAEEIRVEGSHVRVTLNGHVIVDAKTDHNALKKPEGFLGFKGHGAHVEFRNLKIKEL